MTTMRILSPILFVAGFLLGDTQRAGAAPVYDAVNDFSIASNPNGPWSYGALSAIGGTFTPFSTAYQSPNEAIGWTNNLPAPDHMSIAKNISGAPLAYNTEVLPPDLLNLDGESGIADVRWTAPQSGVYNISGRFQRVDYVGNPVSVRVAINGVTVFALDDFRVYNVPVYFSFNGLSLAEGTVVDFAQGAPQYEADSTGLAATISYQAAAVPEPSSLALSGLASVAGIGLLAARRKIECETSAD